MIYLGLLLSLFGSTSFFCLGFADPYVIPKYLAVLLGLALTLWGAARSGKSWPVPPALAGVVVFLAAAVACTPTTVDLWRSVIGDRMEQFCSLLAISVVAMSLIQGGVASQEHGSDSVYAGLMFLAAPMAIYGILQGLHVEPFKLGWELPGGRAISSMGSPLALGAMCAVIAPVALRFSFSEEGLITLGLMFACAGATHTRAAVLAAFVGCCVSEALSRGVRGWKVAIGYAVTLLAAMSANFILPDASDKMRPELWLAALRVFRHHWILGTGPDTFSLAFRRVISPEFLVFANNPSLSQGNAHFDLLQVAATMGVVGLAAYGFGLLTVASTLRAGLSQVHTRLDAAAATGSLAALFFVAKFNPVHFSVLAVAAVILGAVRVQWPFAIRRGAWLTALAAAAWLIALIPSARAERHLRLAYDRVVARDPLGATNEYVLAAVSEPHEITYTSRATDALLTLGPDVLPAAQALAVTSVRNHPQDSIAHESLGMVHFYEGDLEASMSELDRAQELAPTFEPLMRKRMVVALRLKHRDAIKNADVDLLRVQRILGRKS